MQRIAQYLEEISITIRSLSPHDIHAVLTELTKARDEGRTVFTFGNGGSAATASHFACDLSKGTITKRDVPRFRVMALTDNVALLTAWANDTAYDRVFAEQLENLGRAGDVALAISGSGNSPNVLSGIETARSLGMTTIGMTGFDGGRLRDLVNLSIHVPNHNMMQVEDAHLAVCHLMTVWLHEAASEPTVLAAQESSSQS